eukprot:129322-Chlamydomonas_euryale.AAC.1
MLRGLSGDRLLRSAAPTRSSWGHSSSPRMPLAPLPVPPPTGRGALATSSATVGHHSSTSAGSVAAAGGAGACARGGGPSAHVRRAAGSNTKLPTPSSVPGDALSRSCGAAHGRRRAPPPNGGPMAAAAAVIGTALPLGPTSPLLLSRCCSVACRGDARKLLRPLGAERGPPKCGAAATRCSGWQYGPGRPPAAAP